MNIKTSLIEYTLLENGIHEFVYQTPSRDAIDEHYHAIEKLVRETPNDETLLVLVDIRQSGMTPLRYSMQQAQEATARMDAHDPDHAETKMAVVHGPGFILSLAQAMMNVFRIKVPLKHFQDDRDAAIEWLLADS